MNFPISPVNGQTATVNNIVYTYSSANTTWTRTPSAISFDNLITSGNVTAGGYVSATGNITGNYFIGNGSALTGITVAAGSSIVNGTSNVSVAANGNVTIAVTNTSIGTFATSGLLITGVVSASGNVTGSNVVTSGLMSATGNITGGNLLTGGIASITGNISGGNITVTGDATAQNFNTLSDAVVKTNIVPLADPQSIIDQLFGVEYDWTNGKGHSYGFVAQDVEKVLPEAVKTQNGLKSVNYTMIIPFLVETIKQLKTEVQDLKSKIEKL